MKKKAKKVAKLVKLAPKEPTLMDRLPANYGEWLLLCIKFTERAISNPRKESDKMMIEQSDRLQNKLAEWKLVNTNAQLRHL
jgi:hypothetical protein